MKNMKNDKKSTNRNGGRKRRRRRGLSDSGSVSTQHAPVRKLSWPALENVGVTLGTRAAWRDNVATLLGGLMYVMVPTAIERWFGVDLTGWRGYLTSIGTNVFVGAVLREPGYVAGVLGAAGAHIVYARLQGSAIWPFDQYAFRFDPTVTTSSMSDDTAPALPAGTTARTVAGETIALYPPSPAAANVGIEDNYQHDLGDNYQTTLRDNYQAMLRDNYQRSTNASLGDNYQTALRDNFQTSLRDAFGGSDPWGSDVMSAFV